MGLRLRGVVDGLVKVVIGQGSVLLAEFLRALVRKHLGPKLTTVTFWDGDRGDDACGEEGRSISRSMPSAMSLRPKSSLQTRTRSPVRLYYVALTARCLTVRLRTYRPTCADHDQR
jgi:hypothetical protein